MANCKSTLTNKYTSHLADAAGSTLATYAYDANGNMTCRMEGNTLFKQTYNADIVPVGGNRISSIQKLRSGACADANPALDTKWDFAYDGDGVRTATLITPYDETGAPQTATLTSYYFGGAYEVTHSTGSGQAGTEVKKYYSFGGQTVMRDANGLQYFLSDHLGSVVAVTSDTGTLTSQQRYLPFGGERTNIGVITQTDLGYTGQRDLSMGLMDYHARFYSPYLSRFVQPDSLIPDPVNPQAWNRYSYVSNRPVNFNDPTGHYACGDGEEKECATGKKQDPNEDTYNLLKKDNGKKDDPVTCGQQGMYSSECPGWHDYTKGPNLVCPARLHCTKDEMIDYLSRFAYPGQNPVYPVQSGDFNNVSPLTGTSLPWSLGSIQTIIYNGGLTATNVTQPGHIFYDGIAKRTVFMARDGSWYVRTHSYGNNTTVNVVLPGPPPGLSPPNEVPMSTALLNEWTGPYIFGGADQQMLDYILANH